MKMGDVKWVKDVNFNVVVAKPRNHHMSRNHSLSKVSEVVVVSSCKGGVGKSTVAVNLAFTMSQLGARVGILDADIYGPSLPIMINPLDKAIRSSRTRRNFVEPVDYLGVKCISFGFVNRGAAPGAGGE
jgi:Mrp family chromosome partitioning ATPase